MDHRQGSHHPGLHQLPPAHGRHHRQRRETLSALLPCVWGYHEAGQRLAAHVRGATRSPRCVDRDVRQPGVRRVRRLVSLAPPSCLRGTARASVKRTFITSSRYELAYWDMATAWLACNVCHLDLQGPPNLTGIITPATAVMSTKPARVMPCHGRRRRVETSTMRIPSVPWSHSRPGSACHHRPDRIPYHRPRLRFRVDRLKMPHSRQSP